MHSLTRDQTHQLGASRWCSTQLSYLARSYFIFWSHTSSPAFNGKGSHTQTMLILLGITSSSKRKGCCGASKWHGASGIVIYVGCYYFHSHTRHKETNSENVTQLECFAARFQLSVHLMPEVIQFPLHHAILYLGCHWMSLQHSFIQGMLSVTLCEALW